MNNINLTQGMKSFTTRAKNATERGNFKSIRRVLAFAVLALLSARAVQLMNSIGDISSPEKNLIIVAVALTLLAAVPIIALNIYSVLRLRNLKATAEYSRHDSYSIRKEIKGWIIPIAIVALVTFLGWGAIH